MNSLDSKINTHFPGLVARKDLVKTVKGNAIMPSYVLEYPVFFKIVVTVWMLRSLLHRLFLCWVQRRRPNRLAVSDGACTPA